MIDAWDAIRDALRELAVERKRAYVHNVPEKAAQILVRELRGTTTIDEAYAQVKRAAVELAEAGLLDGSFTDQKIDWKLKGRFLDYEGRRIASAKIGAALRERQQSFSYKLAEIHSDAVKAGAIGGSAHLQILRDAFEAEVRERTRIAWATLQTIAVELRLPRTTEVGDALKTEVRRQLIDHSKDLVQASDHIRGMQSRVADPPNVSALIDGALVETSANIDLFSRGRASRADTRQPERPSIRNELIFMSHASADARLGTMLKDEIVRRMPGVEIFCASYPGDIPLGFRWSSEIQRALQEAAGLVLIATARSIARPWIWFESGTFWFDRPIIPLCFGEVRKDTLPPPLNEKEATNLDTAKDIEVLLNSLAEITGIPVTDTDNLEILAAGIAAADRETDATAISVEGWRGAEWNGKFLAYDGPIEEITRIEDAPFECSMQEALQSAGYKIVMARREQLVDYIPRGFKQVFLTDRRRWRREIAWGDTVLVTGPNAGAE